MTREEIYLMSREFFKITLITYILLSVAEFVFPGSVSNFFNKNMLLILVICTGILMIFTQKN